MKLSKLKIFIVSLLISQMIHAKVRELYVNSDEMKTINLKMGQSTILRFQDKPKKVVIGNQNYFNVEFIDNDVTIQPLGMAKTNLFVYGEYNTYGFLIDVNNRSDYDDLVIVKRGFQTAPQKPVTSGKKIPEKKSNLLTFERFIGRDLKVSLEKMFFQESMKVYVMDLIFQSQKNNLIKISDLDLKVSQSNKPIKESKTILDEAKVGLPLRARIFFRLPDKRGFTVVVNYQGNEIKQIIEEKYL